MQRKLILICVQWFSPAYKAGGPIVSIINLLNNYHTNEEYRIYCSNTDLLSTALINIKIDCWVDFNNYTKVFYSSKVNTPIKIFKEIESEIKPDLIYINGIYSLQFNLIPLLFSKSTQKIIAPRGMLHSGALNEKRLKKYIFLKFLKIFILNRKIIFHATNELEKQNITKQIGKKVNVIVAENFPKKIKKIDFKEKKIDFLNLITIALISPMKNYLNIIKALEKVKEHIQYNIYGPIKEKNYWHECVNLIERLPPNIKVAYHGDIRPEQVEEVLLEHHVYIQPSKSENFGHSLLEALSAGKPVITSNNTPWSNLEEGRAGLNVNGEDFKELTSAISFFAKMNNETYFKYHSGAIEYSRKAVDFQRLKTQYDKLFLTNVCNK